MASVTDPDAVSNADAEGGIADANITTWKWYRSSTEISDEIAASYTVTDSDVPMHIRVVATYSDGSGGPVGECELHIGDSCAGGPPAGG